MPAARRQAARAAAPAGGTYNITTPDRLPGVGEGAAEEFYKWVLQGGVATCPKAVGASCRVSSKWRLAHSSYTSGSSVLEILGCRHDGLGKVVEREKCI